MNFKRTVLSNGLRVLTIPMPSFESATVMIMVGAGSRYETKLNNGISHFLEHMAFKGTKKYPTARDITSLIDGMGGQFNASTGKEVTAFYIKSEADRIELSVDVLSDMLKNSKFDSLEIEKEKGVIIEEINMYEDTPMRNIADVYERLAYGNTPLGWNIAGGKDIVRKTTREDFISYMRNLYSPNNITVVFAGGIDNKKAVGLADKYLGNMVRFDTLTFDKYEEDQEKPRLFLKTKKTEQAHVAIGFKTVRNDHPDKYPLEVLAAILGGGMSSRLFHEIREKRGLGYYVGTSAESYQDAGTFVTTAGFDPKRIKEAIMAILEEHEKVRSQKSAISSQELKKAKEYLKGHMVLGLENSRSVAYFYAAQELLEKEIDNPDKVMKKIDAVTIEQLENVTKKYFVKKGLSVAIIGNFTSGQEFENLLRL
ncbi:MAG: pitrilysin family protein [Candidatus Levybacteria bacterium]|nr:pitrilysin family protein [Candidatus Levybacteria bacterium]MDZ4227787.1 pitrilysin family protein [Candidatus Levybacteria bacterium]